MAGRAEKNTPTAINIGKKKRLTEFTLLKLSKINHASCIPEMGLNAFRSGLLYDHTPKLVHRMKDSCWE